MQTTRLTKLPGCLRPEWSHWHWLASLSQRHSQRSHVYSEKTSSQWHFLQVISRILGNGKQEVLVWNLVPFPPLHPFQFSFLPLPSLPSLCPFSGGTTPGHARSNDLAGRSTALAKALAPPYLALRSAYCFASVIVNRKNVTISDSFICFILTVKRRWWPVYSGRPLRKR